MHRFSAEGLGNAGSRGSAAPPRKIWSLGRKLHMALLTITFIICMEVPPPYRPIALTVSTIWRDGVKINASCYIINLIFFPSAPPPVEKWFPCACRCSWNLHTSLADGCRSQLTRSFSFRSPGVWILAMSGKRNKQSAGNCSGSYDWYDTVKAKVA